MKKIFLLLVALTFTVGLFGQPKGYKYYVNEKYQYAILIPNSFGGMGESESGDGQVFVSPDGDTHLRVFGGFNAETLLGTSFDEEYQAKLKELTDRKVELLSQGTMDDPDEDFDLGYYFEYVEDGLYHALRSIWWGDRFATAEFWCYQKDKERFNKEGSLDSDVVLYSLAPQDRFFLSEADRVRTWCSSDDYFLNVYVDGTTESKGKQPSIEDFFLSFAVSNQTPLTMVAMEKINDPEYEDEDIAEWILDKENGYLLLQLVSDGDYWVEACSWDKDNGHKLFLVNYHAPNQALICFDYDPEKQMLHTDQQTLRLLQNLPKAVVELPREGQTIDVYYYKDLSKPVKRLTWNGKGFQVK